MSKSKPDILIVGAGPVGLTAAVELTRRGYTPRIIEKDPGPHVESRALAINPRTLDILKPSGTADRLLKRGSKIRALTLHGPKSILFRIETRHIPHPEHDYMLVLPQAETERQLIETLGGTKKIGWDTQLDSLQIEEDKVKLSLLHKGKQKSASADIVIGADGAHSTVRKSIGIGFTGDAYEHEWGLLDAHIEGLPQNELHVFDLSPLLIGFIPIRDDLFRVVADTPDVLDVMPNHLKIKKIIWESRFRISHRQVETYQKGPVFLAGDAAHIHSPLGGRGMNLGIEDAAWLAYLIDIGNTGEYTNLRHPIAKTVLKQVDAATRFMSSDSFLTTALRRAILPVVGKRNFVQKNAMRNISGLASPPPPWLA